MNHSRVCPRYKSASQVQSIRRFRSPFSPWLSAVVRGYLPQPHRFLKSSRSKDHNTAPPRFRSLMNPAWKKTNVKTYLDDKRTYNVSGHYPCINDIHLLHYAGYILVADPLITTCSVRPGQILWILDRGPASVSHVVAYLRE